MPFFLFIVGVSLVLSFKTSNSNLQLGGKFRLMWNVTKRCFRLFLLGLLMQGGNFPTQYDLTILRIPGILQRIAFAQFVVAAFEIFIPVRDVAVDNTNSPWRFFSRWLWHWVACVVALIVYALLMYVVDNPSGAKAQKR